VTRTRAVWIGPVAGLLAVVPAAVWWSRLPHRMATHWDLGGRPDGSMSRAAAVGLLLGVAVVAGVASGAFAARRSRAAGLVGGLAALFAWVTWTTVLANEGARSWRSASHVSLVVVVPGVVIGVVTAVAIERALPRRPLPELDHPLPSAGLRPGERAAWSGRVGWTPVLPAAVALLALVVLAFVRAWPVVVPLVVVAVALSAFCPVRVSADRRGLLVRYGWLPWPVTHIPLSNILRADAIDLQPMEWGGWGYRGSRRAMGRAAVVLRRGPAIKLDLADGSTFAVTVDGAAEAAGVLNDLRASAPGG